MQALESLSTVNPTMKKGLSKIMKTAIDNARKKVVARAKEAIPNDPRRARNAVKRSSYRRVLGGNISLYSSRKAGKPRAFVRPHKLRHGQRGGNRRPMSGKTAQMESYYGKDRSFVLRWIEKGTTDRYIKPTANSRNRKSGRFGNRGKITPRPWFTQAATSALKDAEKEFSEGVWIAVNKVWTKR